MRRALHRDPRGGARGGLRLVRGEPACEPVAGADAQGRLIADHLARLIGPERFGQTFGTGVRFVLDGAEVRIEAPSRAAASLIERRFGPQIIDAIHAVIGENGTPVRYVVAPRTGDPTASGYAGAAETPTGASPDRNGVRMRSHAGGRAAAGGGFRLEDFVVGPSNRLAYAAALRLIGESADAFASEDGGGPRPDSRALPVADGVAPLFIHGPCGVGKTHLLHALARRFSERHPGAVVRVVPAEVFLNEFISAIRHGGGAAMTGHGRSAVGGGGIERFRRRYRRCDLLCIDDVQFLVSKQATQQELQHTFDQIVHGASGASGAARIVLSCDQHPRSLRIGDGGFAASLVSRFMAGMVAEIGPPDATLRARAAELFAERRGLKLEPGALNRMVEHTGVGPCGGSGVCSIRDIEGLVTRIDALHRVERGHANEVTSGAVRMVGATLVDRALGDGPMGMRPGYVPRPVRPIRTERIIAETCMALGVEQSELGSSTRHRRVVLARALITHLCRELTTMSFPEIARALGRPNHSTVITAHQRLSRQIESGEVFGIGPTGEGLTVGALLKDLLTALTSGAKGADIPLA